MARIFITGSADGLGQLAAKSLVNLGHQVVLHARNKERAKQALEKVPGAEDALIGDLASIVDDLQKGFETQVWLAVSNDSQARVSGHYFHHKRQARYLPAARDVTVQEKFLAYCERISGIRLDDGQVVLPL